MHIRDLHALEKPHPSVHQVFMKGNFVARQSNRPFSALALDQAHEQLIGGLKGDGGMIGITEDPSELKRLLVIGPEMVRLIKEFEMLDGDAKEKHHKRYNKFQATFRSDVQALMLTFIERGHQFQEDSGRLIELQNFAVMPKQERQNAD